MTKLELHAIECRINEISEMLDWLDPDKDWKQIELADIELKALEDQLKESYIKTKKRELGLRLIQGGAA